MNPLLIPPGSLCYINALEGEVWMSQGSPQRRWLKDLELDAWAATVGDPYEAPMPVVRTVRADEVSGGERPGRTDEGS